MNKKWIISGLVSAVLVFFTDFLIHGVWLKDLYMSTASLWRPEADMKSLMPVMMTAQLLSGVFFSVVFAHGYKGKGPMEGARFGLLMGGFMASGNLMMHAVAPYTTQLTMSWIVGGFVQAVIVGIASAMVWGKQVPVKK